MIDPERGPLVRRAFQEFGTGRFTQEEVRATVTRLGLRNRRGHKLTSQQFGRMLQNNVYAGIIVVRDYAISGRGDFESLISEQLFFRVQAVLAGRVQLKAPPVRNHPDFPLRGLVRCEECGKR